MNRVRSFDLASAVLACVLPLASGQAAAAPDPEPVAIGVQTCRRGAITADDTVLILGAGEGAFRLIQQLHRTPTWAVVGLLDDDTSKIGRNIAGMEGALVQLRQTLAGIKADGAVTLKVVS